MATSITNPKVDFFFSKAKKWQHEMEMLRIIILDCGLDENLKWGVPCYSIEKSNIVLIHAFKDYCAVLFFKGALLKDTKNILIQQTVNVQAARQIRFISANEIVKIKTTLKAYIVEAIEIEKAGLKVNLIKNTALIYPVEFQSKLDENDVLKKAFDALTPGRQRGYHLYFAAAKQAKTRAARVEKCMQQIMLGKGLED